MDYIKIRLSNELDQLGSDLKKTMDDIFGSVNPMFSHYSRKWVPPMDLFETQEEITIVAAVGGVERESLEVEINQRAVRICGSRKAPVSVEKARFCLAEIQYGRFDRVLFLPTLIDTDKVSASLSRGLLRITMGKHRVSESKKIPIKHLGR